MGNFNDGFWNLFIIVCTLGGIFAMYLLTAMNSRATNPAGDGAGRDAIGRDCIAQ